MTVLEDLELEWAAFMHDEPGPRGQWTQDQRWRADNPGALAELLAYRAGGLRPSSMATWPGVRMLHHLDAWMALDEPPSPPEFGTALIPPPPRPLEMPETVVSTWSALRDLVARGNARIRVKGKIGIPIDWKWQAPNVWVYADVPCQDGFVGGHPKINTSNVWIDDLDIRDCPYDGVKLGDGTAFRNVVIEGCWIHECQEQGILLGGSSGDGYWILRNVIERVGLGGHYGPDDQRNGHCIYTGGPARNGWILANDLTPNSYAVHAYPDPTDLIVSGNTFRQGRIRSGMVWFSGQDILALGNVGFDQVDGMFTVANTTSGRAEANVAVRCPLWVAGYQTPPGAGNVRVETDTAAASYRVVEDLWPWLPPYMRDGRPRVAAVVGA